MKTILFFLSVILFHNMVISQEKWDYPIKLGTDQWKKIGTYQEALDLCQIPIHVLSKMNNSELIYTWLNYPLLHNIMDYNSLQYGFEQQSIRFNGLNDLLKRNDIGKEIMTFYYSLNPLNTNEYTSLAQKGAYLFKISMVQIFISQSQVLQILSLQDKKECLKITLNKLENQKMNNINFYSSFWAGSYFLLLGRILENVQYNDFLNYLEMIITVKDCLKNGNMFFLSPENHEQIIVLTIKYLNIN